jgi:hypothetical protein
MSALLNHNSIPYIPWKSIPIFNQLTTTIKKNKDTNEDTNHERFLRPGPLKINRREIAANIPLNSSCSRFSCSIDELNRPNGYIITDISNGLANTLDIQIPNSYTEQNKCSDAVSSKTAIPCNALRRCRSSGMIKKNIDLSRGDSAYFTNTNQYLVSRSKTFKQNQYSQVRYEDTSLLTNPSNGNGRFYIPNGFSHCQNPYYDGVANPFQYKWIDGNIYTVSIPAGYYNVYDLNAAFRFVMTTNKHYFVNSTTVSSAFLLNISYNTNYGKVELQVFSTNHFPSSQYMLPISATWTSPTDTVPSFIISNNRFQEVIGFSQGNYPAVTNPVTQNQGFVSNMPNLINPSYIIKSYKPKNHKFAQEGGVSGSSLIQRKKYDTIQTVAASYNNIFGSQVANAMSYGVSEQVYTLKSRLGFPMKKTPVISKITGEVKCVLKMPNVAAKC